jgi:metabolite-proton symporter
MVLLTAKHRALIASLTGSSIEWFDFFLYGSATALVFNKVYFSNLDPVTGLLLSYLTFSLTFFIRPFGGIVFAHIGDRIGRKRTLVATLCLMGFATVLIGLLPGYDTLGGVAPLLLILFRICQGIGLGGEWGGALLLAYEFAPQNKRGLYGSVPQVGVTIGLLMASTCMSVMTFVLSEESFIAWGWRVPFVASIVLVLLGLWLRKGLDETPDFQEAQKTGNVAQMPLVETLRYHWRPVLQALGLKVAETAPFYIFAVFIVSYASNNLDYSRTTVLNAVMIGALVSSICIPLCGALSDRIGRPATFIIGVIAMALFIFPYFMLLDMRQTWSLMLGTFVLFGLIWSPVTATLGTLYSDIFDTRVRYTGVTLGYQVGASLAGGTAPLVATWLLSRYNNSWTPIAWYVICLATISFVSALTVIVSKKGQR